MPSPWKGAQVQAGIIAQPEGRMTRDALQRRSKKSEVAGFMPDGRLKVRLTAPPVEGAANRALVELLAQVLEVRAAAIESVAGATGRDKIVSVLGLAPELVDSRLRAAGRPKPAGRGR